MRKRSLSAVTLQALVAFGLAALLTACGGGGGGSQTSGLVGTWDLVQIEAASMRTSCPGEIGLTPTESVSCGTIAWMFNADGTFVEIQTTDEFGNPFAWRSEGTWSTQGSTLTVTYTAEGPDAGNLQPIIPPESESVTYSLSANTLTITDTIPVPFSVTIIGTLQRR